MCKGECGSQQTLSVVDRRADTTGRIHCRWQKRAICKYDLWLSEKHSMDVFKSFSMSSNASRRYCTLHCQSLPKKRTQARGRVSDIKATCLLPSLPGAKGWRDEMKRGRDQWSSEPACAVWFSLRNLSQLPHHHNSIERSKEVAREF